MRIEEEIPEGLSCAGPLAFPDTNTTFKTKNVEGPAGLLLPHLQRKLSF